MLTFKSFIRESVQEEHDFNDNSAPVQAGMPKALHDFLWHLSAPNPDGRGQGPEYNGSHTGKQPLLENVNVIFRKYISEAKSAKPQEPEDNTHPLLKTSKEFGLDHPHHPLNIVRRGIDHENSLRHEHNKRVEAGDHSTGFKAVNQRIHEGVHAAFKEHEIEADPKSSPAEKAKAGKDRVSKAKDSQAHFRDYMHREGGHAKNNTLTMLAQNGKTASSKGAGRNTIGLSLAPHHIASHDPTGKVSHNGNEWNTCPHASAECKKDCLGITAGGNRQYPVNSLKAKVLRQRYLAEHPEHATRVISHELHENEKFADSHETIHDKNGSIVGHQNKKSGQIKSEGVVHKDDIKKKLDSGEYHKRKLESGARLNMSSDLRWHKLGDGKIMKHHPNTQFYDYTKDHKAAKATDLPHNYKLAHSHTGDNHPESNSHHVTETLRNGGVAAMVYQRGKGHTKPKRVKVIGSKEGHDEWHVANGDGDDNIDQRHDAAADHHEALANHHREQAHKSNKEADKATHLMHEANHKKIAQEYRTKKRGVVSGLELKGVKNESAGNFANHVDEHGTIWIHDHKHGEGSHKTIPIHAAK